MIDCLMCFDVDWRWPKLLLRLKQIKVRGVDRKVACRLVLSLSLLRAYTLAEEIRENVERDSDQLLLTVAQLLLDEVSKRMKWLLQNQDVYLLCSHTHTHTHTQHTHTQSCLIFDLNTTPQHIRSKPKRKVQYL